MAMLFISAEDFFQKVRGIQKHSAAEEKILAARMNAGDADARQAIVNSYLPMVAANIRRYPKELQTLDTVYTCIQSLEEGVDRFNFLQDSETFTHHLSWCLRQCLTRCIVEKRKEQETNLGTTGSQP